MGYASTEQVRRSIGNINTTAVPDEVIEEAIEEADSIIDSKCQSRYQVPFSPVPKMIRRICRALSAYFVFNDVIGSGKTVQDDVKVYTRYDRAMRLLNDIQKGTLSIVDGTLVTNRKHWSNTETYKSVFDVDDELNWGVDSNELDEVKDEREEAGSVLPQDYVDSN